MKLIQIAAVISAAGAAFAFWAASQSVPDNMDTMIAEMNRIGKLSQWAAGFSLLAAVLGFVDVIWSRRR